MNTYRIQHPPTKTDLLTTDFMDIWNELEKIPDGDQLTIRKEEMTVPQFEIEIKKLAELNKTINTTNNGPK